MGTAEGDSRIPAERQEQIIAIIRERGAVRVTELSELFDVSVLTIRRDLDLLETKGILERSHGGAILRQSMRTEPLYTQKEKTLVREKRALARAAAALVEDGDTVFINSGSTNRLVLEELASRKIRIVTNHVGALEILKDSDLEVILVGGYYRPQSRSLVGSFSDHVIRRIFANKAIIGVDGISLKNGLTTPIEQEAEVARLMIEQTSGSVIVTADHTKIGVVSNFSTAPLSRVDFLVTDQMAGDLIDQEALEREGVRLILSVPED